MEYLSGIGKESPQNRGVMEAVYSEIGMLDMPYSPVDIGYFLRDEEEEEYPNIIELQENPHQIEEDLRSPAIKNPVGVKSALTYDEDSQVETKENRFDYVLRPEYMDEIIMFPGMEDIYFLPREAEIFYLSDLRKHSIPGSPTAEMEGFAEAA